MLAVLKKVVIPKRRPFGARNLLSDGGGKKQIPPPSLRSGSE
jgi:hypothetical protein